MWRRIVCIHLLLLATLTLVLFYAFSQLEHSESIRSPRGNGPEPPDNTTDGTSNHYTTTTSIPPTTKRTIQLPSSLVNFKPFFQPLNPPAPTNTVVTTSNSVTKTSNTVLATSKVVVTTTPENITGIDSDNVNVTAKQSTEPNLNDAVNTTIAHVTSIQASGATESPSTSNLMAQMTTRSAAIENQIATATASDRMSTDAMDITNVTDALQITNLNTTNISNSTSAAETTSGQNLPATATITEQIQTRRVNVTVTVNSTTNVTESVNEMLVTATTENRLTISATTDLIQTDVANVTNTVIAQENVTEEVTAIIPTATTTRNSLMADITTDPPHTGVGNTTNITVNADSNTIVTETVSEIAGTDVLNLTTSDGVTDSRSVTTKVTVTTPQNLSAAHTTIDQIQTEFLNVTGTVYSTANATTPVSKIPTTTSQFQIDIPNTPNLTLNVTTEVGTDMPVTEGLNITNNTAKFSNSTTLPETTSSQNILATDTITEQIQTGRVNVTVTVNSTANVTESFNEMLLTATTENRLTIGATTDLIQTDVANVTNTVIAQENGREEVTAIIPTATTTRNSLMADITTDPLHTGVGNTTNIKVNADSNTIVTEAVSEIAGTDVLNLTTSDGVTDSRSVTTKVTVTTPQNLSAAHTTIDQIQTEFLNVTGTVEYTAKATTPVTKIPTTTSQFQIDIPNTPNLTLNVTTEVGTDMPVLEGLNITNTTAKFSNSTKSPDTTSSHNILATDTLTELIPTGRVNVTVTVNSTANVTESFNEMLLTATTENQLMTDITTDLMQTDVADITNTVIATENVTDVTEILRTATNTESSLMTTITTDQIQTDTVNTTNIVTTPQNVTGSDAVNTTLKPITEESRPDNITVIDLKTEETQASNGTTADTSSTFTKLTTVIPTNTSTLQPGTGMTTMERENITETTTLPIFISNITSTIIALATEDVTTGDEYGTVNGSTPKTATHLASTEQLPTSAEKGTIEDRLTTKIASDTETQVIPTTKNVSSSSSLTTVFVPNLGESSNMHNRAINECETEAAACDDLRELCIDLADGYRCDCRPSLFRHGETGACEKANSFDGNLRILQKDGENVEFNDKLADPASPEYQQLAEEVSKSVDLIFEESISYSGNQVTGFRAGSIIASYRVFFTQDPPVSREDVINVTKAALGDDATLPGSSFVVDPVSVRYLWTNECLQEIHDCSVNARCRDRGSLGFTCVCNEDLKDDSPPSLPGRICLMPTSTISATTLDPITPITALTTLEPAAADDEWETWLKVVIALSITFGIFLLTVVVSLIHNWRVKRNRRLRERTDVKMLKSDDGRPRYVDYSYMYEQPISEPRSNEEVGYDADASLSPSEASDLQSLAMGSFPPTPTPTPMPPRRNIETRDASVEVNMEDGNVDASEPSNSRIPEPEPVPSHQYTKLTGILALMQAKGKLVADASPFASRQVSQDTVDSNLGDDSEDERRQAADGGVHKGAREPADGQATESKRMTFLNIPTEKDVEKEHRPPNKRKNNHAGVDNIGYESQHEPDHQSSPDPSPSAANDNKNTTTSSTGAEQNDQGAGRAGQEAEDTSCLIM